MLFQSKETFDRFVGITGPYVPKWLNGTAELGPLIGHRVLLMYDTNDAHLESNLYQVAEQLRVMRAPTRSFPDFLTLKSYAAVHSLLAEGSHYPDPMLEVREAEIAQATVQDYAQQVAPTEDTPPAPAPFEAAEMVWPTPADLFMPIRLPQLKAEWLPDVIAEYALDQSEIIGCDPVILAASAITVCASASDDAIKVQPNQHNHGWTESARLWTAIIGDPSSKKSPGISKATSHLRKIDIDLYEVEQKARAEYGLQRRIYEAAEKAYIADQAKGGFKQKPEPPVEPKIDRMLIEDTTIEAMSEVLKNNPRGILLLSDELSGWLGSMDAYKKAGSGGADRPHWLTAYNGGPRRIDRISRGATLVPNWSACVLGGIQPDVIRKIFTDVPEDGLLQRFIPIVARPGHAGSNRAQRGDTVRAYHRVIDRLVATVPNPEWRIALSEEAEDCHDRIRDFYYELRDLAVLPKPLLSFMGKWEGLSPRLMLTFHLIECATHGETVYKPICEATAVRVMNFMKEFLFDHAYSFYQDTLADSGITDAVRWVGGYILSKNSKLISNRELLQNFAWWRAAKDWDRQQVWSRLVDFGWCVPHGRAGDKTLTKPTQYVVSPLVHFKFEERAREETERRKRSLALIRGRQDGS
jgi:hypothetical protein